MKPVISNESKDHFYFTCVAVLYLYLTYELIPLYTWSTNTEIFFRGTKFKLSDKKRQEEIPAKKKKGNKKQNYHKVVILRLLLYGNVIFYITTGAQCFPPIFFKSQDGFHH